MNFEERWALLLDGRDRYPWGKSVGLSRGVIDGMGDAVRDPTQPWNPQWKTLDKIRLYENASPVWLATGEGTPYLVNRLPSDEAMAAVLGELLKEERRAYVISFPGGPQPAIVLSRQGHYMGDGKPPTTIEYTELTVLVGPAGMRSQRMCIEKARTTYVKLLEPEQVRMITGGKVGTYRLLLAPDAWLQKATVTKTLDTLETSPETNNEYTVSEDENRLVEMYRSMAAEEQTAYLVVGKAMAKKKKP